MESLDFINEAEVVLKETSFGVKEAYLSKNLPCLETGVHINLTTLEGDQYCVYLDLNGYEIVGKEYDCVVDEVKREGRVYETFSSLLDNVSPMYQLQFGMAISDKLKHLIENQQQ